MGDGSGGGGLALPNISVASNVTNWFRDKVRDQAGDTALGQGIKAGEGNIRSGLDKLGMTDTAKRYSPELNDLINTQDAGQANLDKDITAVTDRTSAAAAAQARQVAQNQTKAVADAQDERDLAIKRMRRLAGISGGVGSTIKAGDNLQTLGSSFNGKTLLGA